MSIKNMQERPLSNSSKSHRDKTNRERVKKENQLWKLLQFKMFKKITVILSVIKIHRWLEVTIQTMSCKKTK